MKTLVIIAVCFIVILGCARVRVEARKDPIKVDISMRLDVYQHVTKDIDSIEDIVSGTGGGATGVSGKQMNMRFINSVAYAEEGLSPDVEQAALRRRDRRQELVSWEAKGVVGENKSGLVEVRKSAEADAQAVALVKAENSDRMVIYQAVAAKNGTSVAEVQKLYAQRLQNDAPSGTPIEVPGEWKVK
jgi:uncharacterized protein